MAFQLKPDETVRKGIRRIARKQIDKAREGLAGQVTSTSDETVHDARKRFKRLRAVARLVRGEVGERRYRRENLRFRDAARPLSEVRDAHALSQALDKLAERFAQEAPPETWQPLREALQQRERHVSHEVLERSDAITQAVAALDEARPRLKRWPLGAGFSALAAGLKRSYKLGRQAHARAAADPATENLHEWRKRVKDLWHHVQILQPSRPRVLDELADKAHELADLLGDDHDLAVLREIIDGGTLAPDVQAEAIKPRIDRRRAELQRSALERGGELFGERPKEFVARLRSYWRRWHRERVASSADAAT
jgi:CHAD domain-containing protein